MLGPELVVKSVVDVDLLEAVPVRKGSPRQIHRHLWDTLDARVDGTAAQGPLPLPWCPAIVVSLSAVKMTLWPVFVITPLI